MQKGLVTHSAGKTHRNTHTLKQSWTECVQKSLLAMTELQIRSKGIRKSRQETMVDDTHTHTHAHTHIEPKLKNDEVKFSCPDKTH